MGLLYKIRVRFVNFLVFFFIAVLLPGLPPRTTFPFEGFSIPPLKELKGALEVNNHLDNTERLFEGKLFGPEALLVHGKDIYTTVRGGEIVRINGQHITHVAKLGRPCETMVEEELCGRPLGMAMDTQGSNMVVADSYYGIWLVDLTNGDKKQLVSPDLVLDGKGVNRKARIFNSVAVAKNGDIYWSDSSSDFDLQNGLFTLFANPSGRLFHYNRKTKTNTVLLDRLYFANGVTISPNDEFVLIAETMSSQIRRVYLKGPKAGTDDIFTDGLPGLVDNLQADEEGLWVPLVMAADEENPSISRLLCKVPLIRKFLARMLDLAEMPFRMVHRVYPSVHTQRLLYAIGHFEMVKFFNPERVTIVRLDWNGNIVGSLHGFDKSVTSVSHAAEVGEYLYLGSPYNDYLGRVKLPKVPGSKVRIQNVRVEKAETTTASKPTVTMTTTTTTTTTPKPTTTTTTPKPTTTTTTPKPTTTTTTPKPTTTTRKPTTTEKPVSSTTTTPKPTTTTTTTPKPKTTPKASPKPTEKTTQETASTTAPPVAEPVKQTTPSEAAKKVEKKEKQSTTTTTTPPPPEKPTEPAPIHEKIPNDTPKPKQEKLKVIKKGGEHGEL